MEEPIKSLLENPTAVTEILKGLITKYKDPAKELLNQGLDIYEEMINDDRHYDLQAKGKWKSYNALINVGFTEDQAMMLLLNNNSEYVKTVKSWTKSADKAVTKKELKR